MKNFLLIALTIVGLFAFYKYREPDLKRYDKYMCAVYGYYEDCKTPLKPEDRLK